MHRALRVGLLVCTGLLGLGEMRAWGQVRDTEAKAMFGRRVAAQPPLLEAGEPGPPIAPGPVLLDHPARAHDVVFHPDGTQLATGGSDGRVRLWDARSRQMVRELEGHKQAVYSVAFLADGKTLASAGDDPTVRLWNVATGRLIQTLEGHTDRVHSVSASSDGALLASGSGDNTVRLWNLAGDGRSRPLLGHEKSVVAVSVSPDGTLVASASLDHTVRVWDSASGQQVHVLKDNRSPVRTVQFSPDGALLASGSDDHTVRVWDVASGRLLDTLSDCRDIIIAVRFSRDGQTLGAASFDRKMLCLWETKSWRLTSRRYLSGTTGLGLAFSPDGQTLASAGRLAQLVPLAVSEDLSVFSNHGARVVATSFHPDGQHVATGSTDGTIRMWDIRSGALRYARPGYPNTSDESLAFSPDGAQLAVSAGLAIELWNASTGALIRRIRGDWNLVRSVAFSPDGSLLQWIAEPGALHLWDLAADRRRHKFETGKSGVFRARFNRDGTLLAMVSRDRTLFLWDVINDRSVRWSNSDMGQVVMARFHPDGTQLATLNDEARIVLRTRQGEDTQLVEPLSILVSDLAFSPDGATLAAIAPSDVRIYNPQNRQLIRFYPVPDAHRGLSSSVLFTPDSRNLSIVSAGVSVRIGSASKDEKVPANTSSHAGSNALQMLDPLSGVRLRSLGSRSDGVLTVDISPDSTLLASGSRDDIIRIWDLATGRLIHALTGHGDDIEVVRFSPDGAFLAAGSRDSMISVWNPRTGAFLRALTGPGQMVNALSFNSASDLLAAGSADNGIYIWRTGDGALTRRLTPADLVESTGISALAFHDPEGANASSLSALVGDRDLVHWDLGAMGQNPPRTRTFNGALSPASAFSRSGKYLAIGGLAIRVHQTLATTGTPQILGEEYSSPALAFSPDDTRLAASNLNHMVELWDLRAGRQTGQFVGHTDEINAIAFSPDGNTLATGSDDNTIRLWDLESGTCRFEMRGLQNGGWVTRRADGTLWRADSGLQLSVSDGLNSRRLPAPSVQHFAEPARLSAELLDTDIELPIGEAATARVRVHHRGTPGRAAPAYHVHVNPAPDADRDALGTTEHFRARLDPGAHVDLPVTLTYYPRAPVDPLVGPRGRSKRIVEMTVESAHSEPVRFAIPVDILSPELYLHEFELIQDQDSESASVLLGVGNRGEQYQGSPEDRFDAVAGQVTLVFRQAESGAVLAETPPQPISAPLLGGESDVPVSFVVPDIVLKQSGDDVVVDVVMTAGQWPTLRWTERHPLDLHAPTTPWLLFGALALLLLTAIGALLGYQVVFRNPIVTRLTAEPAAIVDTPLAEVPAVHRQLARARRLQPVLDAADIPLSSWQRLRTDADTGLPTGLPTVLARALRVELGERTSSADDLVIHALELPALPIAIERMTAVCTLTGTRAPGDLGDLLRQLIDKQQLGGRVYLLVIDSTTERDAEALLRDSNLRALVITPRQLTRIALAERPIEPFCQLVASQARLGDISPYQTSGGLRQSSQFVGRHNEMALLTGRQASNYLLIGARQMGKSTLLRRLNRRAPERTHLLTLTGADLDGDLKRAGLPALDELRPDRDGRVPYLLMDEADKLIAEDRNSDYALCRHLRAISEEGRCHFVMAGFWELHRAAYLEHQSPVRNFADPLPLGPLDPQSASDLATQPLAALGLTWADQDLVAELLRRTGRRPNLIALACDAAIRALEPLADRVIDRALLDAILDVDDQSGAAVARFFGDLGSLINDPRACRIDRMVMFATCRDGRFTQTDARARIAATGAEVAIDDLRESLARLTLAYVIQRQQGDYVYPVPLIRDVLLADCDDDPDEMLTLEARAYMAEHNT